MPSRKTNQMAPLAVGAPAPGFRLKDTPDQHVSLSDFTGQPVVLVFYKADFNPVCANEMAVYNEVLPEFQRRNAQVLGISVDAVWSHIAFAKDRNLHFPLLSDFHPKGHTAQAYHAYVADAGEAARAVYVLDEHARIAWGYIAPPGGSPGADGALKTIEQL